MKARLLLFVGVCSILTFGSLTSSYGQALWSKPIEISPLQYGQVPIDQLERRYGWSWLPDMTLGPDGSVHAVWYGGLIVDQSEGGTIDLLMYRRRNADGSWEPVRELIAPGVGGYTVRTSITLGRDDNLHVLYRAGTQIIYSQAPWNEAIKPQAWSDGQLISDTGYYVALAADQTGRLHAFWSDGVIENTNPRCYGCGELFYRRSTDNGATWSPVVNLSQSDDGENRPQVRVDNFNRIHIVWDEGADWYAGQGQPHYGVYRRSDDGGLTWTDPVKFSLPSTAVQAIRQQLANDLRANGDPNGPPLEAVQQTALAVDASGNPSVVYRGVRNDRVYFQRSLDGGNTWLPATEIPYVRARNINDNNLDYYSLAADSANNIHLLMVGFTGVTNIDAPPALIHLTFDGTRWLPPRIIMQNERYPELPRLAIYNGNQLHAVWFTRSHLFEADRPGERPFYQIWYSTAQLNLPARPGLPLFTPTPVPPTPTAGASVAVAPTATPIALPDEIRNAPALQEPIRWEAYGLQAIGMALALTLMSIGIIGGLIVVVRRRQQ
ncbi:BNR-4 repeat-containing protein [Chloroflexus sp.]|uniref:BNR-4 repeat-containing protein n=1 Tax=Chloroflexus sp. TaxID=1904827 RepID=UPI002ACDE0D8|nr:BNR-4 repeat-containing protein [Chloroflexus sp.]